VSLLSVAAVVVGGALAATALCVAGILGPDGVRTLLSNVRRRPRELAEPLALVVAVLLLNKVVRDVAPEVSHLIGWNITGLIYRIEGPFVAHLQSVATPALTAYFSIVYLPGYVLLLVFPFLAYGALEDLDPLRRTAVSFAANYTLGLVLYTLFVSYGPRNLLPDAVEPLLYSTYPQSQLLVSEVNTNTNVFPSLHTSLSITVALIAWQTRRQYPLWTAVSVPIAASVVISTMYLGIHWAIDVLAGALMAWVIVRLASRRW
jgi:membrane-associated phospholipid phosphatase